MTHPSHWVAHPEPEPKFIHLQGLCSFLIQMLHVASMSRTREEKSRQRWEGRGSADRGKRHHGCSSIAFSKVLTYGRPTARRIWKCRRMLSSKQGHRLGAQEAKDRWRTTSGCPETEGARSGARSRDHHRGGGLAAGQHSRGSAGTCVPDKEREHVVRAEEKG